MLNPVQGRWVRCVPPGVRITPIDAILVRPVGKAGNAKTER